MTAGLALASCDENSWNKHLNGFDEFEEQPITEVETVEMTLPDGAYATIAALEANKNLAGEEGAEALAAVGSLKRFSADAPASVYVPAYLNTTDFPYYTLTDGSAVKLTYNVAGEEPAGFEAASAPQKYTVGIEQYELDVWGEEDWVAAFAPSMNPADYIPMFLNDFVNHENGNMCVVSYEVALQEPVFGGTAPEVPVTPQTVFEQSFTEDLGSFTIDNVLLPEELEFIWSWGGANYGAKASAFKGSSFASESWLVSPIVDLGAYTEPKMQFEHVVNKFPDLEFAKNNCTLWAREGDKGAWKQIEIPQYTDNTSWTFGPSGEIDLSDFAGKKMQFAFKYVSELDKSGTWEVKNLTITALPASRAASRAQMAVATQTQLVPYFFDGNDWAVAKGYVCPTPADYTAMGQAYPNLSAASPYLPLFLKNKFPYAVEGDTQCVIWNKYAGGASAYTCTAFEFKNGEWVENNFITQETAQFVRAGGKWMYDPNVTITLPAGKNQPMSALYFQTCTDWVFENICKPLGDTNIKSGLFYVTSYGNNEYYSGTSAYQGNVDLRAESAYAQYPAGYEGMTEDEIIELEKTRFMNEVMPGALGILHADAELVPGFDVLYTINFSAYYADRTTRPYTAVFKLVAKGTFEPVSCTWWDDDAK